MSSGGAAGFHRGKPGVELGAARDTFGRMERHAAGGMGREIREGEIAEGGPVEVGDVLANPVVKREDAIALRLGGERHGEELADGAELEQRVRRHRGAALGVRETGGEDKGLAVDDDTDGEARNAVLGHDRLEHARGDAFEARLIQRHGRRVIAMRRGGKEGNAAFMELLRAILFTRSLADGR